MFRSGVFAAWARVVGLWFLVVVGCSSPLEDRWLAYRAAKAAGDHEAVREYLADDARIWFESRDGDGSPIRAEGGPYAEWDRVFRSTSTHDDVLVDGNRLSSIVSESNDYYRMLERTMGQARMTWTFDDAGRITEVLYEPLPRETPPSKGREPEFRAWAERRCPGLLDSDEMETPKQPERWRALLIEWRRDAGLAPIVGQN